MFNPKSLAQLAEAHRPTLRNLAAVEQLLTQRFANQEAAVRALVLSAASGEPLLLIGPPGTGKSGLIRAFCALVGLVDVAHPEKDHPDYFEYLLTPFTEPSELFGYYDIPQAMKGALVRIEEGMMQNARVVYLDEVFNGSSAILNAILAFLNERVFHDRGMRKRVKLECLFAATNHIPDAPELRAVLDRFVLRTRLDHVESASGSISTLLRKGWAETYRDHQAKPELHGLLDRLHGLRKSIRAMTNEGLLLPEEQHPLYRRMAQLVSAARQYGLSDMSNRRLVKMTYLMLVNRLYQWAIGDDSKPPQLQDEDLLLLPRYFLDDADPEIVARMERGAVAPMAD